MIFTERALWTMLHGVGLGGIVLLTFSGAFYSLWSLRSANGNANAAHQPANFFASTTTLMAVALWAAMLVALFIVFPAYRAAPPEGATDLTLYPRSLLRADPNLAWGHSFAMEAKEHLPWSSSMIMTAIAYIAVRYNSNLRRHPKILNLLIILLLISCGVIMFVGLMGVFVNKLAPLQ